MSAWLTATRCSQSSNARLMGYCVLHAVSTSRIQETADGARSERRRGAKADCCDQARKGSSNTPAATPSGLNLDVGDSGGGNPCCAALARLAVAMRGLPNVRSRPLTRPASPPRRRALDSIRHRHGPMIPCSHRWPSTMARQRLRDQAPAKRGSRSCPRTGRAAMSDRLTDFFVKCPGCHAVNRLVTTPLSDSHAVGCSQCGTRIGEFGKLKLVAESQSARPRFS